MLAAAVAAPAATAPVGAAAQEDPPPTFRRIDAAAEAYLHYSLGRLMEVRGLLSDALVQYRRAESLDPGHCEIGVAIGRVFLALGMPSDARTTMESAVARCPESIEAVSGLATALTILGEHGAAEDVLAGSARRATAPEELVVLLAQALLAQDKVQEADELYRARAATDSLSARIAFLHAQTLLVAGRPDEALSELTRARRLDPENRAVRATLGRLLVARGRAVEGVEILERLLSETDGVETEYVALARGYSELDMHDRAIATIESATEELGESVGLLTALGSIQFRAGAVAEALTIYERVLKLTPDSVTALNFLAYTLADEDLDPERALEYATRAVELDPDSGYVRDTLGWAYYKLGRFEDARREIEAAIELGGDESVIHEHLGDALHALGLVDEAVSAWSRALELEPDRRSSIERIDSVAAQRGDPRPPREGP